MAMLDLRQMLMKISEVQFKRVERLMRFIDAIEEKEFDPLLAKQNGGYKPNEITARYKLASKVITDLWGAALKTQMTSLGDQVPDELEALYYQLLAMSEKDVDRLSAVLKVFKSDVDVEDFIALAEKAEGGDDVESG